MTKYVKNYRITITADNGLVLSEESAYPSFFSAMHSTLVKSGIVLGDLKEGQSTSVGVNVNVECLLNRPKLRRPRRAPEVIAQEKKERLEKAQQTALARKKAEERAAKVVAFTRQRIRDQIDYAFAKGARSGSEPVAKYITCQHCCAPAAFLCLNAPIPPGAAVLDEATITNSVCAEHNYGYGYAQIVSCSRLEFFYEGIRQIAIKAGKP